MLNTLENGRPAGDLLSRVVRVTLSGQEFVLPVRSIRFNREWKQQLDTSTAHSVDALRNAGDDWEKLLTQLARDVDPFIDLLASYAPEVLSRETIETIEPDPSLDVIAACREVWLAASPLVDMGLKALTDDLTPAAPSPGSRPTSSPRPSTAGSRKRSRKN